MRRRLVISVLVIGSLIPANAQERVDLLGGGIFDSTATWTRYRLTGEDLLHLPGRSVEYFLPLLPGIADVDGGLHFRGGRNDAVFHELDGFAITNPVTNRPLLAPIPEAIEGVDVHTGPFGAAFGRTTGGLVQSRMRTGGDSLRFSMHIRTDEMVTPGRRFLNTTVQGYRDVTVTASGPAPGGIRFFLAGRYEFRRNRQPMFLEPFRLDSVREDMWGRNPGQLLPGPVEFERNFLPHNRSIGTTLHANAIGDFFGIRLQTVGSFAFEESIQGNWPNVLRNYFRQRRNMILKTTTQFVGAKAMYEISPVTVTASIGFSNRSSSLEDPHFGNNWPLYTDSLANAEIGYPGFRYRYHHGGPSNFSALGDFSFSYPSVPNNRYEKTNEGSIQFSFITDVMFSEGWRVNMGITSEHWTLRKYSLNDISFLMQAQYGFDGNNLATFSSSEERRSFMISVGRIFLYGYDVDGNVANAGPDAPRMPAFTSAFLNNTFESDDLSFLAGIRVERYDLRLPYFPHNDRLIFLPGSDWIDESQYIHSPPRTVVLPRLSLSIRPAGFLIAYTSYGAYAQMPALQLFLRSAYEQFRAWAGHAGPYGLTFPLSGHELRPERASHFEAGLVLKTQDYWILRSTFYHKSFVDLTQLAFNKSSGVMMFENGGEAVARGMEISVAFQPGRIFSFLGAYAFSDIQGTATTPRSNWAAVETGTISEILHPLGYRHVHRGTLAMTAGFAEDAGEPFRGLRTSAILSFNSGRPYTREGPLQSLGPFTLWNQGTYSLSYPLVANAIEAPHASTTPWVLNLDLRLEKELMRGFLRAAVFVEVLNVFNQKHVLNVFPATGTTTDDGFFNSELAREREWAWSALDKDAYRTINLENRWSYMNATKRDLYGTPRQIRMGLTLEM